MEDLSSWLRFATFDEDFKLWENDKWGRYNRYTPIYWDMTNITAVQFSDAIIHSTKMETCRNYYGKNFSKLECLSALWLVRKWIFMCCTPCTLEMYYGLIPLQRSNIVKTGMPSKPRWCMRFGWIMVKYAFYVATSHIGGEEKVYIHTDVGTYIQMKLIGKI